MAWLTAWTALVETWGTKGRARLLRLTQPVRQQIKQLRKSMRLIVTSTIQKTVGLSPHDRLTPWLKRGGCAVGLLKPLAGILVAVEGQRFRHAQARAEQGGEQRMAWLRRP